MPISATSERQYPVTQQPNGKTRNKTLAGEHQRNLFVVPVRHRYRHEDEAENPQRKRNPSSGSPRQWPRSAFRMYGRLARGRLVLPQPDMG